SVRARVGDRHPPQGDDERGGGAGRGDMGGERRPERPGVARGSSASTAISVVRPSHQPTKRSKMPSVSDTFITPEAFLAHWQGHRRLASHVIDAIREDQIFAFSIGGMRSFGVLALEMLSLSEPMVGGLVNGDWNTSSA